MALSVGSATPFIWHRDSGMMSLVRFTLKFGLDFASFGIVDSKALH